MQCLLSWRGVGVPKEGGYAADVDSTYSSQECDSTNSIPHLSTTHTPNLIISTAAQTHDSSLSASARTKHIFGSTSAISIGSILPHIKTTNPHILIQIHIRQERREAATEINVKQTNKNDVPDVVEVDDLKPTNQLLNADNITIEHTRANERLTTRLSQELREPTTDPNQLPKLEAYDDEYPPAEYEPERSKLEDGDITTVKPKASYIHHATDVIQGRAPTEFQEQAWREMEKHHDKDILIVSGTATGKTNILYASVAAALDQNMIMQRAAALVICIVPYRVIAAQTLAKVNHLQKLYRNKNH